MSLSLFYASDDQIDASGGTVTLSGDEAAHIARALRARAGEEILVADGEGNIYTVRLRSVEPAEVRGSIESAEWIPPEMPEMVLLQALARPTSMDEAVGLASEAGVSRFVPFLAPRSPEGSLEKADSRLSRWRKIAVESSKVARRPRPLLVDEPQGWPPGASLLWGQELNILLYEDERRMGLKDVLPAAAPVSIGIIIGPEGGFDESEAGYLQGVGAVTAGLGDLILRTRNAGSFVSIAIRYHYGLLRPGGG